MRNLKKSANVSRRISGLFLIISLMFCSFISLFCGMDAESGQAEVRIRDDLYTITVPSPMYKANNGPIVFLDESHYNYHTLNGRYKMFGELLEKDGYKVMPFKENFTRLGLEKGRILAIANALHESNHTNWDLPNPSAFTEEEIRAVHDWVKSGGALLLIADHMPFPGAAADLAAAFGFKFYNGLSRWFLFDRNNKSRMLVDHEVTNGRNSDEKIDSVHTMGGQAFEIPEAAKPILLFGPLIPKNDLKMPIKKFGERKNPDVPRIPIKEGFAQGAVMEYGKGRIAIFGEAMMFSVQGDFSTVFYGMHKSDNYGTHEWSGPENAQFLLNIIHWLEHKL